MQANAAVTASDIFTETKAHEESNWMAVVDLVKSA